jgi:hypothetical protein
MAPAPHRLEGPTQGVRPPGGAAGERRRRAARRAPRGPMRARARESHVSYVVQPPPPLLQSGGTWNQPGPAGAHFNLRPHGHQLPMLLFCCSPHFPGAHEHWDRPQLVREKSTCGAALEEDRATSWESKSSEHSEAVEATPLRQPSMHGRCCLPPLVDVS